MKMTSTPLVLVVGFVLMFAACKKDSDNSNSTPTVPQQLLSFNYETAVTDEIELHGDQSLANATFEMYTNDPDLGGSLLMKGMLDESGNFESTNLFPSSLKSVYFKSTYIGLQGDFFIPIDGKEIHYDFKSAVEKTSSRSSSFPSPQTVDNVVYTYMGSYNSSGVPSYLVIPGDNVDQSLINACNASLPESNPVPIANPHYLASGNATDLPITATAEVWITFMHEGAGYRNALGYYKYPTANPPATANDIDSIKILFPNISFSGSGGGLATGDKVSLGTFSAGESIGWVIFQNAWNGSVVNTNALKFYSNPDFNPETTAAKRQHNVLLKDEDRDIILIGFEDLHRNSGSDDDFNDAVFYASANPITAIVTNTMPPITNSGADADNDGVPDSQDDYPNDGDKAFNNFVPFQNSYSSIAFEDLWPSRGDYDFNDLVVKANYNNITNGSNELVEMNIEFIVDHIGASFHNGFGIEFPLTPSEVTSAAGYNITDNLVTINGKGLESGQTNAVVVVFDDAFDNNGDTLTINVVLSSPVNYSAYNVAGLNPFIFVNGDRGREVHLPNKEPTDLVNNTLLGTVADVSSVSNGIYYKTSLNEPWAISISHGYEPPVERINIKNSYLKFEDWVNSNGDQFLDWYEDKPGYRNTANIQ